MSFFFKARSGNFSSSIGIFFIRLTLGSMFLFAGARKILDLKLFIQSVQETGQMNDTVAFVLAFILPFMEMIFGALYIIGLFTPIASFFLSCMTISFLIVLGVGHTELPFSYNVVFLACSVATMFTGAGLISFDALMDRKKVPKKIIETEQRTASTPNTFSKEKVNESDAIYIDEKDVAKGEDVSG
ncbi:MAG: DoxX family protein [Bacteroidota bacterium]|nr:DoxX family protein [Bacteroidota bacterium]